jgi:hypothetical protein
MKELVDFLVGFPGSQDRGNRRGGETEAAKGGFRVDRTRCPSKRGEAARIQSISVLFQLLKFLDLRLCFQEAGEERR